MRGTGYIVKIAKINSQQEKTICPNCKNHQLVPAKHKNRQSAKINSRKHMPQGNKKDVYVNKYLFHLLF